MKSLFSILLSFIWLLPGWVAAQNHPGFSKLYRYEGDTAKRADIIDAIAYDSINNNLFFVTRSTKYYPMPWHTISVFYKTDMQGNVLNKKVLSIPNYEKGYTSMLLSADGQSIYWGGWKGKTEVDTFITMLLTKTDRNLNVIWEKNYATTVKQGFFWTITEEPESGYLYLLGAKWTGSSSSLPEEDNKVYFIKMDSLGNILSEQTPGSGGYDNGESMVKTTDGNFLVSGKTWGWAQGWTGSIFAMKVDTAGNEIWHQFYAQNAYAAWIANNLSLGNGEYVNVGQVVPVHNSTPTSFYGTGYGYINKINENGQLLWEKQYLDNNAIGAEVFDVVKASEDNLVTCGAMIFPKDDPDAVPHGWIMRLDQSGNTIWSREVGLYPGPIWNKSHEYLYDIIALKDGSFVASGSSAGLDTLGRWTQDGWLIRFDSNGCITQGCNLGIANQPAEQQNTIRIYPNPTQGLVHISRQLPFPQKTAINLIDNRGRHIKSLPSPAGKTSANYNLKDVASGVYFLKIKINNRVQKEKLVIRR